MVSSKSHSKSTSYTVHLDYHDGKDPLDLETMSR